jgi:hypothetical protein
MASIIAQALTSIVVAAFLGFILASANKKAPRDKTEKCIRLRRVRAISYAGYASLIMGVLMVLVMGESEGTWTGWAMAASFAIGGQFLVLESLTIVVAGPEGLDAWSPWSARRQVSWEDVREVTFSFLGPHFTIHSAVKRIRVSTSMCGIREFKKMLKAQLSESIYLKAKNVL